MNINLFKTLKLLLILSLILLQSCFVFGNKEPIGLSAVVKQKETLDSTLSSVDVSNNQVTITGSGFSKITTVKITGTSTDADLIISSVSDSQIVATASSALSLLVGNTFDLIIGTAEAQVTYTITFTLQDGAVTAGKIAQMGATSGQVLKWNGTTQAWAPATLSSSQVYRGSWDATGNSPSLSDATAPPSGEYYIVTTAGTRNLGSASVAYLIGDWVMSNGATWDKITGSLSGAGTTNYFPYYASSSTLANSPMYLSGTSIGINNTSPGSALDVKGTLRLSGSTSGYVGFSPAAVAGSTTYTLPAADGTNGQVLSTNSAGVLSWQTIVDSNSGGTVTSVASANSDIGVATGTLAAVLTLNSGTAADQIVKLTAAAKLPAVDGSLVTALNPAALSAAVAVDKGGTGLTAGTSGGIPYYSSTSTMATSALLGLNGIMIGGGAGATPSTLATGTAGQILISAGASAPTWTTSLPIANGGTGAITLGAAQSALGITLTGSTVGTSAVVGTGGIQSNKFCVGDSGGGAISCGTGAVSSNLSDSLSDESGTGSLLFGTAPTISNPVITGTLRVNGSTSGYVSFIPAAVAGTTTYLLPSTQGTSGQVLSTDGTATTPTLSWITPATTATTLVGDIGGTIGANTIGTSKVTSTHILDGTILNEDINASAAIDATKINTGVVSNAEFNYLDGVTSAIQTQLDGKATSTLTSAYLFVGNGSNVATGVALSGDATIANTGALTLNTVSVAKGGTGATDAATARSNLALNSAALLASGSTTGTVPVLGASGIVGSNICTGDNSGGIICNSGIPSGSFTTSITAPLIIGGTTTTSTLIYRPTSGVGTTGADHIFQVGNNGATEAMRILNNGKVGIGTENPVSMLSLGSGQVETPLGSATSPSYSFNGDLNTGMYSVAADQIGFAGGGVARFQIFTAGVESSAQVRGLSVSAATPTFVPSNDTNTGVFFLGSDVMGLATGGVERLRVDASGNVGIGTIAPVSKLHVGVAPTASANYGLVSLGSGAFDGSTSGYFGTSSSSNSSGTVLAINAALGYVGDLVNFQVSGASKFKVTAAGNVTAAGTILATGASNFNSITSTEVVTKKTLTQLAPNFFKSKIIALNSAAWTNYVTNAFNAGNSSDFQRIFGGNNVAGGTITSALSGLNAGHRSRIGNVKTGTWASIDWGSKIRIMVSFSGISGRTSFATDSFGVSFGSHTPYQLTAGGMTQLMETSDPTVSNQLIGFKCVAGAVTLWVKNGTGASTGSATIATLTDAIDIGDFVMEVSAGTLSLYRNNVLLGSTTGAPSTVAGGGSIAVGLESSAATQREFSVNTVAIAWE